jgi:hypothetical protein
MNRRNVSKTWLHIGATLLALSAIVPPAEAGQRSLAEFLSRRGQWCAVAAGDVLDCAASYYGGPDCVSGGFSLPFPVLWRDPKTGLTAAVDAIGELLFASLDGSVSESAGRGGIAQVKATIHASHTVMQAFDPDFNPLFTLPIFGDAMTQVAFTNTAQGAPFPDINQLIFCPLPGQALEMLSIHAQGNGTLVTGTPGRLEVTGVIGAASLVNRDSPFAVDAFPAQKVIVQPTGR